MPASERTLWTAIRGITAILPACPTMKPALIFSDRLPPSRDDSGRPPRLLFGCPYGVSNRRVMRILSELEYYPISWTVDSLGRTAKDRAFFIERRITAKPDAKMDGVVMLMHCGLLPETVAAVPRVIAVLASGTSSPLRRTRTIRTKSSHRWFIN